MLSGTSLKTGAGELARMTISPFIFASVFPIKVRMPLVRLKSPRIAMIGIVSPKHRQQGACRPSDQVLPGKSPHETAPIVNRPRPPRPKADVFMAPSSKRDVNASLKIACLARRRSRTGLQKRMLGPPDHSHRRALDPLNGTPASTEA